MENNNEIWKDIEGYEGIYQISSLGRVRSIDRYRKSKDNSLAFVKGKILKGKIDKDGYIEYALCIHNTIKYYRAHRLVAQAFIPNPNSLPLINHINEIKNDNRIENLEWCTTQYNNEYSKSKSILQLDKNYEFINKWKSAAQIESELGFNHSDISKCCRGIKNKTVKGFKWVFETDYEQIPFNVFDLKIYRKKVA